MATSAPRTIPSWFPLALIAMAIAWPTADRVRAADRAPELLVADLRADELLVIDTGLEAVTRRIPLPGGAHELLELPDGRVVVSVEQAGLLAVVDLAAEAGVPVAEIAIGGTPHGLALDGEVLLVTDRASDEIRRFELESWRELTPIATGRWPHAVALTSDRQIAVAVALDDELRIGARAIEVGELPETVSVAADGAIATAAAVDGDLRLFDAEGAETFRVALGGRPVRVLFSPEGESIAVALSASGEVALVGRDGRVRRAAVPGVPDGLAFDRSGERLYVSDVVGGGVAVLETDALEVVSVIEAGTASGAILVR